MYKAALQPKFLLTTLFLGLLFQNIPAAFPDTLSIIAVPGVEAPEIAQKRIKVAFNFYFNHTPPDYWIHYNKEKKQLIIEFFGVHLHDTSFVIKGTDILRNPKINNGETPLSLNNKMSSLSFEMSDSWHYESWLLPNNMLNLQLWMPLNPSMHLSTKKNK